ncbi:MAG: M48 family metalloprotease, partial [Thermoanaerobaculia bacterium]
MRSLRHLLAGFLLVLLPTSGAAAFPLAPLTAAPDSGPATEPVRTQTPNEDLYAKSLEAAAQAIQVYGSWDNPAALERVAAIGYRVAREANYTDFPISFFLADMAEPNAFALPGGQIFVTRGMIELGLNDDALAALLGHEITHVVKKHGTRLERKAMLLNILSQAVLVG